MSIPIKQERYFNQETYEQEVFEFSGKTLSYWFNLMSLWEQEHSNGTDALITEIRDYSHRELIELYNHEIQNAYGYAKLVHKVMNINDHLNSPHRYWMKYLHEVSMPNLKLLDYGCGDLTNSMCFYDMGYKVTAVDLPIDWIKFIEYRCRRNNINIDFRYTYTNDSFLMQDEEFDVVFTHEVLEHVKEAEKVLAYLLKHLKIGGLLFVTVSFTGGGGFHLEENHQKFGPDGRCAGEHPNWVKVLADLHLKPLGNNFYIKEA